MRKRLIKVVVCIIVFVLTLFISTNVYNQGNTDMTTSMSKATLPLVRVSIRDIEFNTLHGLRQDIEGKYFRDTITPLNEDRSLSFTIDKYENEIRGLSFEVRSIDGSRLVESTQITDYTENDTQIQVKIMIKDLIEKEQEYNWILKLETGSETISYCTRIIDASSYHTYDKLAFVMNFHEKTFDKEEAKELVTYLESNSRGDNTTLSKVTIHSSFQQVTWGNLTVEQITEPDIVISEIEEQTASIRMNYIVSTVEERQEKQYQVSEFYRIRYTTDRMYLLDFERTMDQIFEPKADVYASNKIMLGIRDSEVQLKESDGGSNLAFVNGGQLFSYHATDKKLAYIFSFYDELDPRTMYTHYEIKILNVDETGNVSFMVYGYMNRGSHEGEIGIQIYEYNGMLNNIEELLFIPYHKSFAMLKTDVEQLAYLNKSNTLYLYLDGSIVAVDLLSQSYSEIATLLQEGSFQVSQDNEMLVWQNSEDAYDCNKLILMNLNTANQKEIQTTGDNRILPLGFINDDLIYGVAKYADIMRDSSGAITFPMYAIYIQNEQGEILKSYEQNEIYITGCMIQDNLITLYRVTKDEGGKGYLATSDDQIVNNIIEESGYNTTETVTTQTYQTIVQIVLKGEIETRNLRITEPKLVLYEGSKALDVTVEEIIDRYYVYGKAGIVGTFTHPADAINLAVSENGTVIDENGGYIWRKAARTTRNQIMKITERQSDEENSSLAVCLETILSYRGNSTSVQKLLNQGALVTDILAEYLQGIRVLELQGASLDAILYYVNMDIPVMAVLDDGNAVLITGFNELNVVIMNPLNGTLAKMGMNDAVAWFEENGNRFITYVVEEG